MGWGVGLEFPPKLGSLAGLVLLSELLDRSFLADVERGKRNVSILNLDLMAKGLKVSLS